MTANPAEAERHPFRYAAFISYSRVDRVVAVRLQRDLERFVLPTAASVIGLTDGLGKKARRPFSKVFRDEDDLVPGGNLPGRIRDGILNSEFLIVVCSPAAAKSPWVEREILDFATLRSPERVLALIADGEPDAAERGLVPELEALPRALRFAIEDGKITKTPAQPLWIDWRNEHRADRLNFLRVSAALLSLGPTALDDLRRRDQLRERAVRRLQRRIIMGVSALAVIAVSAAVIAMEQRQLALSTQSRYLARESLIYSAEGGPNSNHIAQILALEGLPAGRFMLWPRPDDALAEAALVRARYGPNLVAAISAPAEDAVLSPDGTRILTRAGREVRVWNARTGEPMTQPLENASGISALAFSPDGRFFATGSDDGVVTIRETETGIAIGAPIREQTSIDTIAFSRNGALIAIGAGSMFDEKGMAALFGGGSTTEPGGIAEVFDIKTRRAVSPALSHPGPVISISFSPDATHIVTVCGATFTQHGGFAEIWEVRSGKPGPKLVRFSGEVQGLETLTARMHGTNFMAPSTGLPARKGTPSDITWAGYSPDGKRILTASGIQLISGASAAQLWDAATGAAVGVPMQHGAALTSATFSPDGTHILTTSLDMTAQIWDAQTGLAVSGAIELKKPAMGGAFSQDGSRIVVVASDLGKSGTGYIQIFDVGGTALFEPLRFNDLVAKAAFAADGLDVMTLSGGRVRVFGVAAGIPLGAVAMPQQNILSARSSPDGREIVTVSGDSTARVWSAASGARLHELNMSGAVTSASFSPEGSLILTASQNGDARLWNVATGCPLAFTLHHAQAIQSAVFSPDGKSILTASRDGTARVWDAETGKPLSPPLEHDNWVDLAIFSPDGARIATASEDDKVRIWDTSTWKLVAPPLVHQDTVNAIAFSPDGTRLITASEDRTARVWDARTGRALTPPILHDGAVTSAHFSPDGTKIVTSSDYKAIGSTLDLSSHGYAQVWDAATGEPVTPRLVAAKAVRSTQFSVDGSEVITASDDGTAQVWDVATGTPVTPSLAGSTGKLAGAAFSADGERLLTYGEGKVAWWLAPDRPGPELIHAACDDLATSGFDRLPDNVRLVSSTPAGPGPCEREGLLSPHYYAGILLTLFQALGLGPAHTHGG